MRQLKYLVNIFIEIFLVDKKYDKHLNKQNKELK
jgi:hypothetical protein